MGCGMVVVLYSQKQQPLSTANTHTQLTASSTVQVFQKHGVETYNPANEKFDPNLHQAMFEVPDPTKEAGVVAVVTKVCV